MRTRYRTDGFARVTRQRTTVDAFTGILPYNVQACRGDSASRTDGALFALRTRRPLRSGRALLPARTLRTRKPLLSFCTLRARRTLIPLGALRAR